MSPAKIVKPDGGIIYVVENDMFDFSNEKELAQLPPEDSEILKKASIVGEPDGFIIELPEGDPIKVTPTTFSTIPPPHRRYAEPHMTTSDNRVIKLPGGTEIEAITNEQYEEEFAGSGSKEA